MLKVLFPLLCFLQLTLTISCRREPAKEKAPTPLVKTVTVERGIQGNLELRGSVAAQSRLKLGFKQAGVVGAVLVREGDRIKKGQLLAKLDDLDARSLLRSASAAMEKAKRDAARAERLSQEGALPGSAWEDAKTALESTEAQLAQAKDLLERTRLLAPVAGMVFSRLAEPGETLQPGMPVVLLDSTQELVVRSGVSEREAAVLKPGQTVLLAPDGLENWVQGRLRSLSASPNPADGLYAVEVVPSTCEFRVGALIRMRFPEVKAAPYPSVPLESLVRRNDKDHVFLLENGVTRLQEVQVLRSEGRRVLLKNGLNPGDRIVGEGAYFLQNGQTVRVLE